MGFLKKAKKKDKPSKKKQIKNAVKIAEREVFTNKFLNKNLDRVISGRLTAMSQYALHLLYYHFGRTAEEIIEMCKRMPGTCWAFNYSWNKYGMQTNTPTVTWQEVRHNLEREIRKKLPRWPRLGATNELMEYAFNEIDKAETALLDLCRVMFGWGRATMEKFQTALRRLDWSSDYTDYLRFRNQMIDDIQIAAKFVEEKTFYEGKYEKPLIKAA